MQFDKCVHRSVGLAVLLVSAIFSSAGCQTWHSSAVPGLKLKQDQREILREAKNDPFPSPSDVGMKKRQ